MRFSSTLRPVLLRARDHQQLSETAVEVLITAEQEGVPSVLWVDQVSDLDLSAAALVTHIATEDILVHQAVIGRITAERALLVDDAETAVAAVAAVVRERASLAKDGAGAPRRTVGRSPSRWLRRLLRGRG